MHFINIYKATYINNAIDIGVIKLTIFLFGLNPKRNFFRNMVDATGIFRKNEVQ
jgi:hypothetical protein